MKNILFYFLLFLLCPHLQSQNFPINNKPISWKFSNLESVKPITLPTFDVQKLLDEDLSQTDLKKPWRFGYKHEVNLGMGNAGVWSSLENGDSLWRINFISKGALSINFLFHTFQIPDGATVKIYNDSKTDVSQVFTHLHNITDELLGTWLISGDNVWVEYHQPSTVVGSPSIGVSSVVHGYRSLASTNKDTKDLNDSGDCNIDVNCDIGPLNDFKEIAKNAVAMIVVGGNGLCSGALVNNTNNDGTPYFLTANHCLGGQTGWAFRFHWASDESTADCATSSPSIDNTFNETASGAVLRASNGNSDVALLEITDISFFNNTDDLIWSGWDRSTNIASQTFGIHHPSGDIMKVCVDEDNPTATQWNGAEVWEVSDWDQGVTEPGSSGSPLFNQNGHIIGQLFGGGAACTGTNDNGDLDAYGRFNVSWDNGSTASTRLMDWLDPQGTGDLIVDSYPPNVVYALDARVSVSNISAALCTGPINPIITVRNNGTDILSSATISYNLDGATPTVISWNGMLSQGESEEITISAIDASGAGSHFFEATISDPNNGVDMFLNNNISSSNFILANEYSDTTIDFVFSPDNWASESTWELIDSSGSVLYQGGPYTNDDTTVVTESFSLTAIQECYTFIFYDSFGDGICCDFGNGSFQLVTSTGDLIFEGNTFTNSIAVDFRIVDTLSIADEELQSQTSLYPNPTKNQLYISLSESIQADDVDYTIYSVLGQSLHKGILHSGNNTIDINTLTSGLYFVKIMNKQKNSSFTQKIIIR